MNGHTPSHHHGRAVAQMIHRYGGGGAERVTLTLARGLARVGVPTVAVATRGAGAYAESARADVDVVDLEAHGPVGFARGVLRLRRLLRRRRVRLVHCHNRGSLMMALLARVGVRPRPRLWYTWHIPEPGLILHETGLKRRVLVGALAECEVVWTDSQHIVDHLAERAPVLADRLRVFTNAVPEADPSPAQGEDEPRLLWMARITPIKDPLILMRAAGRLRDEGLRFRIVMAGSGGPADGWYEQQVMDARQALKLESVVEMAGWVDDTEALLARANIGVQTSLQEGLSLTLLEQMMAGLAVVATDCGDTAVAVRDGETGLVVPREDEDALVAALRRVVTDAAFRRRLAERARAVALERFSMTAMAHRVAELLPA